MASCMNILVTHFAGCQVKSPVMAPYSSVHVLVFRIDLHSGKKSFCYLRRFLVEYVQFQPRDFTYRVAAKSLARPGRKQANVSVRMA